MSRLRARPRIDFATATATAILIVLGGVVTISLLHGSEARAATDGREASNSCLDTVSPEPSVQPTRLHEGEYGGVRQERDSSCYLGSLGLRTWLEDGPVRIVDVRRAAEFRKLHLVGAINLERRELDSKAFVQNSRLMLVGDGFGDPRLEATCRSLRAQGAKDVMILDGGVDRWSEDGVELTGSVNSQQGLHSIPPVSFIEQSRFAHWLVVDVDSDIDPDSPSELPGWLGDVELLSLDGSDSEVRREFFDLLRRHRTQQNPTFIVVVSEQPDRTYREAQRVLEADSLIPHLYFLAGGKPALRSEMRKQRMYLASAQNGPLRGRCGQ